MMTPYAIVATISFAAGITLRDVIGGVIRFQLWRRRTQQLRDPIDLKDWRWLPK